eukprot:TRINITY_DN377_c0_g1_i4.p1 TRINITY_DN377_c0_g1~~TRINITY_DN377_c0_g1_i4.p1  ORF type:complete len:348 (-),score=39.09 TRINITY_DN377_c0_g1_i4:32-1075(-)
MIRRPPRSTQGVSSAASDVYKRQVSTQSTWVCKNPVDPQNLDVCAKVVKNSDTDWTTYVGDCGPNKYCKVSIFDDTSSRCSQSTEIYSYPGMKCSNPSLCLGTGVVNGICRGKALNTACESHLECDVGLACDGFGVCSPAREEGEFCDNEHQLCQSYLHCREGICIKYGSIANHHNPGEQNVDLCSTHYINKRGQCDDGPTLLGKIFVDNTLNKCAYSNGEEKNAVCGYHKDGKAICKPGAGDTMMVNEWKELLLYLDKKPKCNPYLLADLGQCDYAEIQEGDEYLRGRIAYSLLHYYNVIQEVPECVQNYIHKDYWELLKRYNGASSLSVGLALFLGLLLLFFQHL